jgi:hypothetical protein
MKHLTLTLVAICIFAIASGQRLETLHSFEHSITAATQLDAHTPLQRVLKPVPHNVEAATSCFRRISLTDLMGLTETAHGQLQITRMILCGFMSHQAMLVTIQMVMQQAFLTQAENFLQTLDPANPALLKTVG